MHHHHNNWHDMIVFGSASVADIAAHSMPTVVSLLSVVCMATTTTITLLRYLEDRRRPKR